MSVQPTDARGTVDAFMAGLPTPDAEACARILAVVLTVVPDAEQGTSYGVAALRVRGKPLLGLNATKGHLSVFPFSPSALDTVRAELSGWDCAKGTIRFTAERPLSDALVTKLVVARLREIDPDRAFSPKTTTIDES